MKTLDHWSVAVHTVAVNFPSFPNLFFMLNLLLSAQYLHLSEFLFVFDIMYYDNGCLLYTIC